MTAKIIFSAFIFVIFVVYGFLCVVKPKLMLKTSAYNNRNKTFSESDVFRAKFQGYATMGLGVVIIVCFWLDLF